MIIFANGVGARGQEAWPGIDSEDALFLHLEGGIEEQAGSVADALENGATLVAHSLGAVPAVLAVVRSGLSLRRLILVEPALYDVARGAESIEAHIALVTRADAAAVQGDLWGFWAIIRPVFFDGPADPAEWESERQLAYRFASAPRPWGHGIAASVVNLQPTTVVTGGWNDEYESVAAALAAAGAEHRVLVGFGHRPQDHPLFVTEVLRD